jgi:hypothetical protein
VRSMGLRRVGRGEDGGTAPGHGETEEKQVNRWMYAVQRLRGRRSQRFTERTVILLIWHGLHAAHGPKPLAGSPRATPCPARRSWRGGPGFPEIVVNGRGMEARQGAIRVFSGSTQVSGAPLRPAIRLYPMRDPVNRPISRSQRERAGRLADRQFARSRIRCSRRPGPACFRQAPPGRMMEGWILSKKNVMAPHCASTTRPTRRSTPVVQPETRKRPTGSGDAAGQGRKSTEAPSPGFPQPIHKNLKWKERGTTEKLSPIPHLPSVYSVPLYPRRFQCWEADAAGSHSVKTEPAPGVLSAVRSPPIQRAKRRLMASPSPAPPWRRV